MSKTEAVVIEVERVMTLDHPLRNVVGFLADFSNAELWDPGTITCDRVGTGGLSVGSEWHNVSEFRGRRTELLYRLARFDTDHLTFVGRNKTATSTDDMRFEEHDGRTRLTYRAHVEFNGLARLATPCSSGSSTGSGTRCPSGCPRRLTVPCAFRPQAQATPSDRRNGRDRAGCGAAAGSRGEHRFPRETGGRVTHHASFLGPPLWPRPRDQGGGTPPQVDIRRCRHGP